MHASKHHQALVEANDRFLYAAARHADTVGPASELVPVPSRCHQPKHLQRNNTMKQEDRLSTVKYIVMQSRDAIIYWVHPPFYCSCAMMMLVTSMSLPNFFLQR
jgi:hypothetical protein